MRLFLAVRFNPAIEQSLRRVQQTLRQQEVTGHYTDCRQLHLTLAFIGEYERPKTVLEALKQIDFTPFELSLTGGIGHFGDLYWAGIEKTPPLTALSVSVREALAQYHIPYDRKPFQPHITLLRKASCLPRQEITFEKAVMTVEKISLMHSHRVGGQLVYTELGGRRASKL